MIIHVIKPGDTVYKLAEQYRVSPQDIINANDLRNPSKLAVGQTIIIPSNNSVHVVKSGQSLYSIALSHGLSLDALLAANPDLHAPYTIYPGQVIKLPPSNEKLGTIEVNGYLYPNITDDNLRRTLPHLTYVSIFSYSITQGGDLIPVSGDDRIISAAKEHRVAPLMVLTNTEEGKGFNSDIISALVNDSNAKARLIENIAVAAKAKGYFGVNVDFEYIPPRDREAYNTFLRELKSRLELEGLVMFTNMAPKISDTQMGTLYESHDYRFNGEVADRVILMTYEWGYIAGPPMAVSPISEVRRVLDYAVTRIPRDKILMSLPGYGYDWTLPFKKGDRARVLSVTQATELAATTGAEIQFDVESMTPFFEYFDSNVHEHIVWFEDAISADAKLRLISEYGLAGVSYWTINQFWPQNWVVLNSLYNVRKVL